MMGRFGSVEGLHPWIGSQSFREFSRLFSELWEVEQKRTWCSGLGMVTAADQLACGHLMSCFLGYPDVLVNSGYGNEMPQTEWFHNRNLFSHGSGAWKSEISMLAQLGSSEDSSWFAAFSVSSCGKGRMQGGERARESLLVSLTRMPISPLGPHLNLIVSQRPHLQIPLLWG